MTKSVFVTLAGHTNAGKSSLLNALAGYERAIVTPIPGTTRDTVEESVLCGGVLLLLPDQQIHIPGGHHPLQHTDSGEIGQVVPVVFLPLRPGHQAALRVVVHHGGGEAVILVEPDHLPVHIAEHLVHI